MQGRYGGTIATTILCELYIGRSAGVSLIARIRIYCMWLGYDVTVDEHQIIIAFMKWK